MIGATVPKPFIALDVDGTLVDQSGRMARPVVQALRKLAGSWEIVLASGRPLAGLEHVVAALEVEALLVGLNGAVIQDRNRRHRLLSPPISRELQAFIFEDVLGEPPPDAIFIHDARSWCAWGDSRTVTREHLLVRAAPHLLVSCRPRFLKGALKITIVERSPKRRANIEAKLALRPELSVQSSNPSYIEVSPPGVSKAIGLRALLRDRPGSRLVAVGDGMNDVPMFAVADCSYAMPSAPPAVKTAASFVLAQRGRRSLAGVLQSCLELQTNVRIEN
jgi:Cof subfamily protein (haloacid dehalogenase superfamily)